MRIVGGATSGSVQLQSVDNATELLDSAGNVDGTLSTSAAQSTLVIRQGTGGSTGALYVDSASGMVGSQANVGATSVAAGMADTINNSGGVTLLSVYGAGMERHPVAQAITCASAGVGTPGTQTIDPQSSYIELTNSDPDGCVWTMQETSGATIGAGAVFYMVIVSDASSVPGTNVNTFPDVANVWDAPTACSTAGLNLNGVMQGLRSGAGLWVAAACVSN